MCTRFCLCPPRVCFPGPGEVPIWATWFARMAHTPGQYTGVGCHALLQGIFPTKGSNPGLPHCRWSLYRLSHQGSPRILDWVAMPSFGESSRPRDQPRSLTLQEDSVLTEPPGKPGCEAGTVIVGWVPVTGRLQGAPPPQEGGREGAATSGQGSALHSPPSIPPPALFLSSSCLVIPGALLWEVRFREMTLTHFCHADMSLGFTEGMGNGVGKISPSWGVHLC